MRVSVLSRPVEGGTEFQVITVWESLTAIHAFAGPSADTAVVPEVVRRMMASYDRHVVHYEIAHSYEPR